MKKRTKLIIILTSVVLVCVVLATVLGVTLAKWREQATTTQIVDLDREEYNPSAPYIIYYGLKANGEFATLDSEIVSWAVVGYRGLVAEVIIPETHTERGLEKPVTHILPPPNASYVNDRLSGNAIITEITIPASVVFIGSGVCSMMSELKKVILIGEELPEDEDGEVQEGTLLTIGDLAFAGCAKLEIFENPRNTEGNSASYLKGTPLEV